jgi:hypothetical protein
MAKDIKTKVIDGLFQKPSNSDWTINGKVIATADQLEELTDKVDTMFGDSDWEKWRKEVNKIPKADRVLEVPWHIDDVHSIREDLTAQQCAEVLEAVGDNHDSEVGVNWDVISWYAEDLFPEKV